MSRLAEVFFDVLRLPGPRAPAAQAQLELAFDHLIADGQHLALHRLLLARHSADARSGVLEAVAKDFAGRLLAKAAETPAPGTGILVALLLLRSELGAAAPMERVPQWHRQAMAGFDAEQSLLLYNTMFGQRHFLRNVAELKQALPELDWVAQWRQHGLKKLQTYLFYWPRGADASRLAELLEFLQKDGNRPAPDVNFDDFVDVVRRVLQTGQAGGEENPGAALHRNTSRVLAVAREYGLRRLGLGGRRLRLAISISGQLRGYVPALASWRKHLLPGVAADFYVHAWKQVGRSGSEPFRRFLPFEGEAFLAAYREQCMKMGYPDFVARYPGLFKTLSASGETSEAHLSAVYGTDKVVLEDDADARFAGWSNSRKMHYKIGQAQSLIDASGREYDLVLRIRPDKAMRLLTGSWADMLGVVGDGKHLLADGAMGMHYGNLMIGDQVALGTPAAMRSYAAAYADAIALEGQGLVSANTFLRGHVSLARQCFLHQIGVGKFPALFGGLLGAAPLSSREIQQELDRDAQGRSDPVDRILLAAVARDLAAR
ncbi:hypothetical protein GT347_00180 [Xylophilus rhododendri]|uniref:Uncharacterized protein n=1 Tax=Xylophilus rhododendri TaxID=2697032 RepID=A0A857J0B8_9BURK|nr:hypothetical protein [Xylophilus rhododendri]QHI96551.1 hypothetical protein GT347_00180 [Xylophilus rhododendri]